MTSLHRVGTAYLLLGIVVGFSLSSFLNNSASCIQETAKQTSSLLSPTSILSTRPKYPQHATNNQDSNGWKLIHVFYGDDQHLPQVSTISTDYYLKRQPKWFSQLRQDEVVSTLLHHKRNGYFVDLAANDAVKISNTFALETRFGWNGLCLEPNPIYWQSLSYRKCHVAGVVVGPKVMQQVNFTFPNRQPAQGGIVGQEFHNKDASRFHEDQPRYTNTLINLFERFQTPSVIDYMSLDVEGAEDYIMRGFPFDSYRVHVLTVERPSDKLQSLLKKNDYIMLKKLKKNEKWGETLWIHKSMSSSIDRSALDIDTEHYKYREIV